MFSVYPTSYKNIYTYLLQNSQAFGLNIRCRWVELELEPAFTCMKLQLTLSSMGQESGVFTCIHAVVQLSNFHRYTILRYCSKVYMRSLISSFFFFVFFSMFVFFILRYVYPPTHSTYTNMPMFHWVRDVLPTLPQEQRPIEFIQESGDIVFLPSWWAHGTVSVGDTLGFFKVMNNKLDHKNPTGDSQL